MVARPPSVAARLLAGAALSAALLALLLHHAEPGRVLSALRGADPPCVVAILAAHLGSLVLRVVRWRTLLRASGGLPAGRSHRALAFDAAFFGWLCNLVLPARLGELARPAMYSRNAAVPFGRVLATSVVERTADLAVLSLGMWLALLVLPVPSGLPAGLRSWARIAGVGTPLVIAALVMLARRGASEAPVGRLHGLLDRFREGLACLLDLRAGLHVLGWTVAVWSLEVLCVWLTFVAFGLEPSLAAATCHVVAVTLSIAVVTVPAGLGVEQAVTIAIFGAWGIASSDALAMSFVLSFAAIAWVLPFGLVAMWRHGGGHPREGEDSGRPGGVPGP